MAANKEDSEASQTNLDSTGSPSSFQTHTTSPPPPSRPAPITKDPIIWSSHPSHIINLKPHAITLLSIIITPPLASAVVELLQWNPQTHLLLITPWILPPLLHSLWKIIEIRCHHYILTTERLRHTFGVLNKHTEEIELYRVRDTQLHEPFLLRLVNAGNIIIISHDPSSPRFTINAVKDPHHFRELLRAQVESCRQLKGVREWQTG
jgi:hypothetical protein